MLFVPANISRLSFGPLTKITPHNFFCFLKKSLSPLKLQGGTRSPCISGHVASDVTFLLLKKTI